MTFDLADPDDAEAAVAYRYYSADMGSKLVGWWHKVMQCVTQCAYIKRDLSSVYTATTWMPQRGSCLRASRG